MTGETGVCTFIWSCNVAHGVHIGPCVDRFFIGSCCKTSGSNNVPSGQTRGFYETAKTAGPPKPKQEDPKIGSSSEIPVSTSGLLPKQEVKYPIPQINNFTNSESSEAYHKYNVENNDSATKSDRDIESHIAPVTSANYSLSWPTTMLPLLSRKPVISHTQDSSPSRNDHLIISTGHFSDQSSLPPNISDLQIITDFPPQEKPFDNVFPLTSFEQYSLRGYDSTQKQVNTTDGWKNNILLQQRNHSKHAELLLSSFLTKSSPLKSDQDIGLNAKTDVHLMNVVFNNSIKYTPQLEYEEKITHDNKIPSKVFLDLIYNIFFPWKINSTASENSTLFQSSPEKKVNESTLPTPSIINSSNLSQISLSQSNYAHLFPNNKSGLWNSVLNPLGNLTTAEDLSDSMNIDDKLLNVTKFTKSEYSWSSSKPLTDKELRNADIETGIIRNISRVCGRPSNMMARIVGGQKSPYLRWPWMVSLRRYERRSFKHKCGATLLNPLWAITAAHCVDGQRPPDVVLRLGDFHLYRSDEFHPPVDRRVHSIVSHPAFDRATFQNDLALLRFQEPVEWRPNLRPVCLPDSTEELAGRTAVVVGWGRLSEGGELPGSLHEAEMPILMNQECEQMYAHAGYSEPIQDVFVCAGFWNGGIDACEGDSGGPMLIKGKRGQWTLVGVISWGMGCAAPKQPGVYTRIPKFVDWIQESINSF